MRSLLLAASFPPALGGVETLLYQTNRRLEEPPVVLAPAPVAASDMRVRAVPTDLTSRVMYRQLWAAHPSLHYTRAFLGPALRAVRDTDPAVIQAGHVYLAPLAWLLAHRLRKKFVVYAYGQEVWRGGRPMGLPALDARLRGGALRAADRVFVPGGFTARLLSDWEVAPDAIVPVPYGAEPRPVAAAHDPCTLLSVARLVPRKGIDMVIAAVARLAETARGSFRRTAASTEVIPGDIHYRVVGSGPDEGRLRRLASSLGMGDRVRFLGRLDDRALENEYQRCTVFVLPARRTVEGDLEGYGLVYFEAAAWGRPVIAGRSGGEVDAVVDGTTGVLVNGESPEEVACSIAALLDDRNRLEQLGAAGRRRVETSHNWTMAARVVDATLAEIV
jgi:phosphatidylinositol alpha-1,6-mannosyltransferase